jgi:hypothetical protein
LLFETERIAFGFQKSRGNIRDRIKGVSRVDKVARCKGDYSFLQSHIFQGVKK